MNRIAPEVWARLGRDRPEGPALQARLAAPDLTERVVAALDIEGNRHLLVLLREDESDLLDRHSRGITAITRDLAVPGQTPGRYIDITCHDKGGHEALDTIGWEIVQRVSVGKEPAQDVVARVLAKWRRFWGELPRRSLSREEQIGLFAELWFMRVWFIPQVGAHSAVERWRGPSRARHDFAWSSGAVEVKATTSTRGRIHRINGLAQLESLETGPLYFFSMRLRDDPAAKNNLPFLVDACREAMGSHPEAIGRFENLLAEAGYLDAHRDEYALLHLAVVDEQLFLVERDFPRLTRESFCSGVPEGVVHVAYEIDLASFHHLLAAETPTAVPRF